jgi:hypothetical protein
LERNDEHRCRSRRGRAQQIPDTRVSSHVMVVRAPSRRSGTVRLERPPSEPPEDRLTPSRAARSPYANRRR